MQKDKISVIIPVYNVEKYLQRCLDSIVNQTYRNLEIILVDDGSKDQSGQICDDYAQNDERIRVIHKQNEGAGVARNVAMEQATGEYFVFVDADDYAEKDMYEKMYYKAIQNNAELVIAGANFIATDGRIRRTNANPFEAQKEVFHGEETRDVLLNMLELTNKTQIPSEYPIDMALWKGMFKRSVIKDNGIYMRSERKSKSEDFIFYLDFAPLCQTIVVMNEVLYYHCDNETSISHNYSTEVQLLNNAMLTEFLAIADKYGLDETCRKGMIKIYLEASHIVILDEFRNNRNRTYGEHKKNMKFVCENETYQTYAKEYDLFSDNKKKYVALRFMYSKNYMGLYLMSKLYMFLKK